MPTGLKLLPTLTGLSFIHSYIYASRNIVLKIARFLIDSTYKNFTSQNLFDISILFDHR